MNPSAESDSAVTVEKKPRLGTLLCWAARFTSLPIFALLLVSLVPALTSFDVSAHEDKIIALGSCGIAVGFLVGWLWAGIGGLIVLLGVGVILTQENGAIASDPFAVAFALQGILFLLSWAVNASPHRKPGVPMRTVWLKRAVAGVLAILAVAGAAIILRGPGPTPVTRERAAYVGVWTNGGGFQMEITRDGRAKVTRDKDAKVASCNTPVPAGGSGEFLIAFKDNRLELSSGILGQTKTYHIDRPPFPRRRQVTMILNGSDPYSRTNGMILEREQAAGETWPGRPPTRRRRS